MRTLKTLIAAAVLLVLAACGNNSNTFPEAVITSVTPAEVTPGAEITVTGRNYYSVTGAGSTRIEVCGVTVSGSLVEPLTRTILLPPGSTITAEVGSTITGTLPEDGLAAGLSDVRVIRPDGSTAVLEAAVTCVLPIEEPEPEPTPITAAMTVSSLTGIAPATITFNAEGSTGEGELEFTWDFGIEDATATGSEVTFEYLQAGTFTVTLTVTDETGAEATASQEVVIHPALQAFILHGGVTGHAPVTISFDGTRSSGVAPLTFAWDFGDDSEGSSEAEPEHRYELGGTYTVTLTVTDANGESDTTELEIHVPTAVSAAITASATSGVAPTTITFNAAGSTGEGELEFTWDFGVEGATASGAEVSFEYLTPGTYTVTLSVTDEVEATAEITQEIVIHPALQAVIEHSEVTSYAPVTVAFDATSSTGISPLTYAWDFGDGAGTSTEPEPSYEFAEAGTYTVSLTVTDANGDTDTSQVNLTIPDATPVTAVITADPVTGTAPLTVNFSAQDSAGEGELEYAWDFVFNNGTSEAAEPEFTFATGGAYTVSLTVTDATGARDTATQVITVDPAPANLSFAIEPADLEVSVDVLVAGDTVSRLIRLPDGTLSVPPGDYHVVPQAQERTETINGREVYSLWNGGVQDITVAEGEERVVTLSFTPRTGAIDFSQVGLPDGDYSNRITVTAVDTPLGLPASTSNLNELVPGLYELTSEIIPVRTGSNGTAYITGYKPHVATVQLAVNSGSTTEHEFTYEVIPVSSITLDPGVSLPAGAEAQAVLVSGSTGVLAQPWVDVPPGEYLLSFDNVDHVNENGIERDNGDLVDAFESYEADSRTVYLSSGEDATFGVDYTLQEALLEISITAPAGENTADVTITDAGGTVHRFTSATNEQLYVPLGEYHVQFSNPSGYRVTGTRSTEGFNLADTSHGYGGGKTSFSVFVTYGAVMPGVPRITLFKLENPITEDPITVREAADVVWSVTHDGNPVTCTFNAGDNSPDHSGSCRDPLQYTYTSPGTYTATLTATVTDDPTKTVTETTEVVVNNPPAPVIQSFTSNHPLGTPAEVNDPVTFEWDISIRPDEAPGMTCVIDFGNNDTRTALCADSNTFNHAFDTHGQHTVTLTVTDEYGGSDSAETTVQVIDSSAPTGTLNGPSEVDANTAVDFTWDINYNGLGDLTCTFNPGDDSPAQPLDCSDGSTTHSYELAGNYTATLTVADQTNPPVDLPHSVTIEATADAPIIDRWEFIDFRYDDPNGQMVTTYFEVQASNATGPVTCSIDFGDNTPPRELGANCVAETQHVFTYFDYDHDETYEATVTITDTHGNRVSDTTTVNVTNPAPPVVNSVTISNGPTVNQPTTFTFDFTTDPRINSDLITCTFNPGSSPESCSSSLSINHTFVSRGIHTVTFTVRDAYNPPLTAQAELTVMAAPPAIDNFEGTPNPVEVGQTVTFRDWGRSYYALSELTCSIDPGDGSAPSTPESCSTYAPHEYIYSEVGPYTARLIVTDDYNRETVFTTSIEVTESSALDLTINTPNLPSGAKPDIIVFRVDPYFHEELTGAGTVTLPGPGTYAIQGFSDSNHQVEVPYNGGVQSYYMDWGGVTTSVTVEAATDKTVNLNFSIPTGNLQAETEELPNSYDITHEKVNARLQRLNEPNGDSWENVGPITTTGHFDVAPGIYRVLVDDVTHEVCHGDVCYTEEYVALEAHPFDISSGAGWDTIYRVYELQTGSITTTTNGLPDGLTAGFDLELAQGTTILPPWDELNPGWYIMRPENVTSSIPFESFDVPESQTLYPPSDGLIDVYYRADPQPVHLSSRETQNAHAQYKVADALIEVEIAPPYGSDVQVLGNISIRAVPNGEWHTFTTMEQHIFYTPPGVYEIKVEDVPADPGAGHNGYRPAVTPFYPYFVAHSYGGGVGYETGFMYTYEPIPAP